MDEALPLWMKYLQATSIIMLPFFGTWITLRQMRLAEAKLKHDLFDRRFAVFEAAANFIATILREGNVQNNDILSYSRKIVDAEFLLDDSVSAYLNSLRERASKLHVYAIESEDSSPTQQASINKKYEELRFFAAQFVELRKQFRPFLKFERNRRIFIPSLGRYIASLSS